MKLAEALHLRADLQKRIAQLSLFFADECLGFFKSVISSRRKQTRHCLGHAELFGKFG